MEFEEKKPVNAICMDCARYGHSCEGTAEPVWTGCIYKVTKEVEDNGRGREKN